MLAFIDHHFSLRPVNMAVFLCKPRDSQDHLFVHLGEYPGGNYSSVPTTFEVNLGSLLGLYCKTFRYLELFPLIFILNLDPFGRTLVIVNVIACRPRIYMNYKGPMAYPYY